MTYARPTIANVDMALADTEYSYALPRGTKKFTIKLRDSGVAFQLCMVSGESNDTYINIASGKSYTENKIKGGLTLYFRSASDSQVAEIISYV